MAIWQNKHNAPYSVLTAQGSQVAFIVTTVLGGLILFSYTRLFSIEKEKKNK